MIKNELQLKSKIKENLEKYKNELEIKLINYNMDISRMEIPILDYNLTGKIAGKAYWKSNMIKLNINYLNSKYQDDMITETLYHEYGHLVNSYLLRTNNYPDKRYDSFFKSRVKPHGKEWKFLMNVMNMSDSVTHDYDKIEIEIENERMYNRITYVCLCNEWEETKSSHNKMRRGVKYFCQSCKSHLVLKNGAKFRKISI